MTVPELARYLAIPQARIYALVKDKDGCGFPAIRTTRGWRVDLYEFQEWLAHVDKDGKARVTPVGEAIRGVGNTSTRARVRRN